MAPLDLDALVDRSRLGRLQVTVLVLCGLAALLDGFDTQAIGYTAPAIGAALNLSPAALGPVFAAGTVGITIGAFALGPLADRVGRRMPLIGCVLWFAVFTLATPFVSSLPQLLVLRAMAGLGLGGAMPSFIALSAEYTPARMRNTVVAGLYAAFPLGGFVGGLVSAVIIPSYGWQPLFIIGGVAPLLLAGALALLLPESVRFLVARNRNFAEIRRIGSAIAGQALPEGQRLVTGERIAGTSVGALFAGGLLGRTVLLWGAFFLIFMVLLTVGVWSTTLLRQAGIGTLISLLIVSSYYLGAVLGSVLVGRIMDRFEPYAVLGVGFALGAACLAGFGQATAPGALTALLFGAGVLVAGASSGLIAVAASLYPTQARSTGIGWAMGAGRFGQILGPLAIGMLVASGWGPSGIFVAAAVPCVVAAAIVLVLRATVAGRLRAWTA